MQLRSILLTLVTGGLVAATPVVAQAAPAEVLATAPYGVVMPSSPRLLNLPSAGRHAAFPGLSQAADGRIDLVLRSATDHANTRDGQVRRAVSLDQGRTFTGMTTVLAGAADYRDPYLSRIAGHEYLTFFTGTNAQPAGGAYVSRDGGPAVRIDPFPYAAVSGPVVQLPNGNLGVAYYARPSGETKDTAWFAWSSNGGVTWSSNRILNPAIESTPEPWLVVDGGTVHLLARWGSGNIAIIDSTTSGQTWGSPRLVSPQAPNGGGCSGRPSTFRYASGQLVMVCRDARTGRVGNAQVALSLDGGWNWYWGPTVAPAPAGSFGMTYASAVEVRPGVLAGVVGMEQADGSSVLYSFDLAEAVR